MITAITFFFAQRAQLQKAGSMFLSLIGVFSAVIIDVCLANIAIQVAF